MRKYSCLPRQLQHVPLAEDSGMLLAVRNITIPAYPYSYNPSLVQGVDGFHLVFRFDIKLPELPYGRRFSSYIGITALDKNFHPKGYPAILDTSSEFSEDPRCTYVGDECYLIFNDCSSYSTIRDFRSMRVAQIDLSRYKLKTIHNLDIQMQPIEKNWIPFAVRNEEGAKLFLSYTINPHKILKLFNPVHNKLEHLPLHQLSWVDNPWEQNWGLLRGGTPAILVGDEYLAFFHSRFIDRETKLAWYVMGAYTFASTPPFQLQSISPHPILFQGIYQTTVRNTESSHLRCIYPSGIVFAKEGDKEVIYVACGENDRAIKILTFDKQKLLDDLIPINQKKE
ncbi:MAG: hypothetical protein ACRCSV_00435 [Chlamydiales bacterium]